MTIEDKYLEIRHVLRKMAWGYAGGNACLADELLGEADVAFMLAMLDSVKRKWNGDLDRYITLRVRNRMLDFLASQDCYRRRVCTRSPDDMDAMDSRRRPGSADPAWVCELSSDARVVASEVIARYAGSPRFVLEKAKDSLYATLGWRRTWEAIEEIKAALEGLSC